MVNNDHPHNKSPVGKYAVLTYLVISDDHKEVLNTLPPPTEAPKSTTTLPPTTTTTLPPTTSKAIINFKYLKIIYTISQW